jgi:hypothetical protein
LKKFSEGYTPGPPFKGRAGKEDGRGKEGIRDTAGEEGRVWDREGEEGMRVIQREGMGREGKGREGREEGRRKMTSPPPQKSSWIRHWSCSH